MANQAYTLNRLRRAISWKRNSHANSFCPDWLYTKLLTVLNASGDFTRTWVYPKHR